MTTFEFEHQLGAQADYLHHWSQVAMVSLTGNAQAFEMCALSVSTHESTSIIPPHKSEMDEWRKSAIIKVMVGETKVFVSIRWETDAFPWFRTLSKREARLIALNGLHLAGVAALGVYQSYAVQTREYQVPTPTKEWGMFLAQVRRAHWDVLGESPMWVTL